MDIAVEITRAATAQLARFVDPAQVASRGAMTLALRPHEEDYARVFRGDAAARAQKAYAALWLAPPPLAPRPGQTELRVDVARSEDFATGAPSARDFPGGYQEVAASLAPGLWWITWRFVAHGTSEGLHFDGLVYLDGRFAWFPKPWRALKPADSTPPPVP